jgi:hypothetical protein
MVRIIVETSLPAHTVERVRVGLAACAAGVKAGVEVLGPGSGCERPGCGGDAAWTPCWLSLEFAAAEPRRDAVRTAAQALKSLVADACREGGVEVYALPANAQIDDGFYRLRDVLDAAERVS